MLAPFDRDFFGSGRTSSRIGGGEYGGKAGGLLRADASLRGHFDGGSPEVDVSIPAFVVLGSDVFQAFMDRNRLWEVLEDPPSDPRIAHAFQKADLPSEVLGDLHGLIGGVHTPLAVRSSSLLEDALAHPFAGVYETKMTPNNQPSAGDRFQRLVEAIKLVYASTWFSAARDYRTALGIPHGDEGMAVVIQEVVGRRFGNRFYPHVSGVARSFNYYPVGRAKPEEGVVDLALGLGKTIVDGGRCWTYSPQHPGVAPPFASARDRMTGTQARFWAVNMGRPPTFDPLTEAEYLVEGDLKDAEYDGTLPLLASTYDAASDQIRPGTGRPGPRVLDFRLFLHGSEPWNGLVRRLLQACEEAAGEKVEIEFALALAGAGEAARPDHQGRAHLGLVQLRSMSSPGEEVALGPEELTGPGLLLASRQAMGNGVLEGIRDIVYLVPDRFEAAATRQIAAELGAWNRDLVEEGRRYLLLGFGRWGSSDPWLGIPVQWGQVAGARVLVEAALPSMNIEPSQGTHFFHNLTSLGAVYMAVGPTAPAPVDWDWLARQPSLRETQYLRHVLLDEPLSVRVDGRAGTGVVRVPQGSPPRKGGGS
ncbi:MAG TPA: PEP/pyruvate-binding domain-containing protein [Longimicrobiales bacterium]|nr:PEP/pyruvate-binding domain-containing protein [Longimicrobiales bacterium]